MIKNYDKTIRLMIKKRDNDSEKHANKANECFRWFS